MSNTARQLVLNRIDVKLRELRQELREAECGARKQARKLAGITDLEREIALAEKKVKRRVSEVMKPRTAQYETSRKKLEKLREQALFARTDELKKIFTTL